MARELFRIFDKDFTKYITVPSYAINSQSSYEEWQDGNGVTHRVHIRDRISGSFEMYFDNLDDYYEFLDYVNESRQDEGYNSVSLYVNNYHEVAEADVYIKVEPANFEPKINEQHDTVSVEIEER